MKTSYLACLAVVAASLAVAATSAVPASAHVNGTAGPAVDETVAPASEFTLSAIETMRESVTSNAAGFTRTAAAVRHGRVNKLSLNPRRPCADPKAFAPGC